MKVIIFGATGYVGLPVGTYTTLSKYLDTHSSLAHSLIRNGHVVVGVSRNTAKSRWFQMNESQ